MKKVKRAYGYIRGRFYKKRWAPDKDLQIRQIKEYAAANGYKLIKIVGDDQKFELGVNKKNLEKLAEILPRCKRYKADILYINTGRYRRNIVWTTLLKGHAKAKKKNTVPFEYIEIPAAKETLEAIERHARYEEHNKRVRELKYRRKKAGEEAKLPDDELSVWKRENKVGTKRLNNFKHLYKGAMPIYKVIEENLDLKPRDIADFLNRDYFLTVNGLRWNRDNTRKVMDLISSDLFKEFVRIMDEQGPDALEIEF